MLELGPCLALQKEIRACHPNTDQRDLCPSPARHSSPHLVVSWSAYLVTLTDATPRPSWPSASSTAIMPPYGPHWDPIMVHSARPGMRILQGLNKVDEMTLEIHCLNLLPESSPLPYPSLPITHTYTPNLMV